jgi:hypothetical protein
MWLRRGKQDAVPVDAERRQIQRQAVPLAKRLPGAPRRMVRVRGSAARPSDAQWRWAATGGRVRSRQAAPHRSACRRAFSVATLAALRRPQHLLRAGLCHCGPNHAGLARRDVREGVCALLHGCTASGCELVYLSDGCDPHSVQPPMWQWRAQSRCGCGRAEHICTGAGLGTTTSAPGLGLPLPARPIHIRTGTCLV